MPLPESSANEWPPPALKPALAKWAEWRAWWSGDVDALSEVYGDATGQNPHTRPATRPAQYQGGVVGALARFWHGRPPAAGEPRTKLHVPVATDLCRASADLLFSEEVEIELPQADAGLVARLGEIVEDGMHARLLSAAERIGALGGGYLRPVWDDAVADHVWLDAVPADMALPEWAHGRLRAVTFWTVVGEDKDWTWRHLERHEAGRILHGLYRGGTGKLGTLLPLDEHPATAHLAQLVDEDGGIDTGQARVMAWYQPRLLPSPAWDADPLLAPMGRSILSGVEPLMDALDETYSSWMRDVRLAKGRITVPEDYLDDAGPGKGATFDPDREVYSALPGMGGPEGDAKLTVSQFAIRVEEHERTAANLLRQIMRTAGLAASTLGEDPQGQPITAREVSARGQRSYVTQGHMIQYQRPALQQAIAGMLAVDAYVFGGRVIELPEVSVEFSDNIADDLETVAGTVEVLDRARSISTETKVRMVHPEWDDAQVAQEVAKILDEAEPVTVRGPLDLDDEHRTERAAAGADPLDDETDDELLDPEDDDAA